MRKSIELGILGISHWLAAVSLVSGKTHCGKSKAITSTSTYR